MSHHIRSRRNDQWIAPLRLEVSRHALWPRTSKPRFAHVGRSGGQDMPLEVQLTLRNALSPTDESAHLEFHRSWISIGAPPVRNRWFARLLAGGNWIRTSSTRARSIWLSPLLCRRMPSRPRMCVTSMSGTRPVVGASPNDGSGSGAVL